MSKIEVVLFVLLEVSAEVIMLGNAEDSWLDAVLQLSVRIERLVRYCKSLV